MVGFGIKVPSLPYKTDQVLSYLPEIIFFSVGGSLSQVLPMESPGSVLNLRNDKNCVFFVVPDLMYNEFSCLGTVIFVLFYGHAHS